jgi:chromosome partitioning protein
MPILLSSINLKGGVGKTTIAVNFAAYCGRKRLRTLLIDLDPQTNATFSTIGVEAWKIHAAEKGTIADLLDARLHTSAEGKHKTAQDVLSKSVFPNVDLIPSHLDLFTVDLDLAGATARERKLEKALKPILNDYEVIICDCPPNLTLPTQNALAVSTHYIVLL